jgi:Integrase core domain/AIPR protein
MNANKKIKARDEFMHFAANLTDQKFGNLNAVQQSYALTQFYIREIRNRLRSEIADEDLQFAIVDGSNDLDCDLIHRDDKQVLIVQARYRGHGATEPAEKISHFQGVLKRLADPKLKANNKLKDQISSIDWKNDVFELVYVTFGKLDNQARKISEQKPNYPDSVSDLDQRCSWTYLDESNLNEELRSALAVSNEVSDKKITLYPVGQKRSRGAASIIEVEAGEHRSIILALDARQIIRAYQELHRDALFSLNIRNYIGNTSTNTAIIKSAEMLPEQFFLFNNGISCLCTNMNVHDDAFIIVRLDRRDLAWINVTTNPTAEWVARQLTEAFPWDGAPGYMIRDRDRIYGTVVTRRLRAMGIRDKPIAPASPWQNGFAERLIGSIRRECLDHIIVLGEAHLRRILKSYARYYNETRTHLALDKDVPLSRTVKRAGRILCRPVLGGLHHEYVRI